MQWNNSLMSGSAMAFIILLGLVSLFADITYEGARSISGQYLALLGANATIVATVAGFGELIGYGFRLVSGVISDRSKRYWAITMIGYAVNLAAVPLLAFATSWQLAAALMVAERFGKSIRTPARDAMLSYATKQIGSGKGFGIHQALDQVGAILGPLFVTIAFFYHESYQFSFAMLTIPALVAMLILIAAQRMYPHPQEMEVNNIQLKTEGLSKQFWYYVVAVSLVAAGYADFPLIAYHFQKQGIMPEIWIPIFYAAAMGIDGLSALYLGRWFDRQGVLVLIWVIAIVALFAPLAFLGGPYVAFIGVLLWGIGLGAQGSIMRAVVANFIHPDKRGTAYGIFNACFGVSWFLGSIAMGVLYDTALPLLIIFSVVVQLSSIPFLLAIRRKLS